MFYWIKTNWIVKKFFSGYIWDIFDGQKKVYLTFDDGPTPEITPWVLSELRTYNAKATFFCIGKNIEMHPKLFQEIRYENHTIGNHTHNHLNGWTTKIKDYIENFTLCERVIKQIICNDDNFLDDRKVNEIVSESSKSIYEPENYGLNKLFRPPYGKIKPSQASAIRALGYKIIMWDVLSADFDAEVSKEKCLQNVLKNVRPGSIIVFHDSQKAFSNLEYVLPRTLEFMYEKGFIFEVIS